MGLNIDRLKTGVAAAVAVGGLFKKDTTFKDPGGDFGRFLMEMRNGGVSRNNKFMVTLMQPAGVPVAPDDQVQRRIGLYAIDVEIPTREIYTEASRIYGTNEEVPVDYQYGLTFQMTFYVDLAYRNLSYFDRWMNAIVDTTSNDISYSDTYAGVVEVMVVDNYLANEEVILKKPSIMDTIKNSFMKSFDPVNEKYADPIAMFESAPVAVFQFAGAYPKSIQVKRLSNNSKEFQEVTVTFAYQKLSPIYTYSNSERYLPNVKLKKATFVDKLIGNATSKVSGVASAAGGIAGSIANIARIGG